jgi:tRNA (cytidine/uridine-2'-O-)-methyltransferase
MELALGIPHPETNEPHEATAGERRIEELFRQEPTAADVAECASQEKAEDERIADDPLTRVRHGVTADVSLHVVLVHPEIHWNTGNAGRTCLAVGATLHLIEPLGFSLEERQVRRAGLDYWEHVEVRVWPDWQTFESALPLLGDPFFFSTRAPRLFWDAPLGAPAGVVLIFGRETGGLPDDLRERYADRFVTMPILSQRVRSLNLSTSIGIAAYEVLRQRRLAGQ